MVKHPRHSFIVKVNKQEEIKNKYIGENIFKLGSTTPKVNCDLIYLPLNMVHILSINRRGRCHYYQLALDNFKLVV